MDSPFWAAFNFIFPDCKTSIKTVLSANGYNSYYSYQILKSKEDFETFFREEGRNVLNPGEKAEVKFIFNEMQKMSLDQFSSVATDDLTILLNALKEKAIREPTTLDQLREILNPTREIPPLNVLLKRAEKNFKLGSKGNRFEENLMKICVYFYIQGGASLYETFSLIASVPSLSEVRRHMYTLYPYIDPGKFYIKEFKKILIERGLKLEIGLAYDDTRIKKDVIYDEHTGCLVGLKHPLDDVTGMPKEQMFKVQTPLDTMKMIQENPPALFMQVIMGVPFCKGAPSFPLAIFTTSAEITSIEIEKRIHHLVSECDAEGIEVKFISSNGAPAQIGGMKLAINFGTKFKYLGFTFPYNFINSPPCFQDVIHDLNKFKMGLFDNLKDLVMGNSMALGTHLLMLVKDKNISKNIHMLNFTDVLNSDSTKDKMSFRSTEKILQQNVIDALKEIAGTEGTRKYLELMKNIYDGFLVQETPTSERIFKIFYTISFLRRWRKFIKNQPGLNSENFITSNCWHSLEINAGILLRLALKGEAQFITVCGSQECEGYFRNLRSYSTSGLTTINFTLYDGIMKTNRIITQETILVDLSNVGISLKKQRFINEASNNLPKLEQPLTPSQLENIIKEASNKAFQDALSFNMPYDDELEEQFFQPPKTTNSKKDTLQYFETFYDTYEFEFDNVLTGEIEKGNAVKIEDIFFLDSPAVNHKFQALNPNGIEEIKITKFLWLLTEKGETLTTDRLFRFKSGDHKEWQSKPMEVHEIIARRDSITIGDIVTAKDTHGFIIGQVAKFEKDVKPGSKKSERRFKFNTLFFKENPNVKFFLWPIANILNRTTLSIQRGNGKFFKADNYYYTINPSCVNLKQAWMDERCSRLFNFGIY